MTRAALDRPVWNALTGPQHRLARGGGLARRIDPGFGPFAAAADRSLPALTALAELVETGEQVWLVEAEEWPAPPGMRQVRTAPLLQMVAERPAGLPAEDARDIVALGPDDAEDMTALARATEPGPWAPDTRRFGNFYGVRRDTRLAAMAGMRLRPASGLAEVSGVCTWPEFRGQGLAGRLIRRVMVDHVAAGDLPFLHSYAGNAKAIALYRSIGFEPRREMTVTVLERGEE